MDEMRRVGYEEGAQGFHGPPGITLPKCHMFPDLEALSACGVLGGLHSIGMID